MASLFVIQGADQGKRFEFTIGPVALGRDDSNARSAPRYRGFPPPCRAPARPGRVSNPRPELGQRDVRQRPARRSDCSQFRRPSPARPDRAALSRGEQHHGRPDEPRGHADQEQSGRPLRDLEDHSLGRGLAGLEGPGRRRRLAARAPDEPVGHVQGNPGHHQRSRNRRAVAADPGAGFRVHRGRPRRDSPQGRIRPARPQGGPMAGQGRARRADDDLADDRRLRARKGRRCHHQRRPHRQAVQPRPIDRRLPDPRSHLRADPGKAYHPRRPLFRHPVQPRRGIHGG